MTKSARNGIVAAAVVAVVAVAAAPFIVKGLKKQPAQPADATVSVTEQTQAFTYPAQEETTADIISEILETMDSQQQTTQPAPTQSAQTQPTTAAPQQTTAAAQQQQQQQTTAATTAKAKLTLPQRTTKAATTKATTTAKAAETTKSSSQDNGPMTAVSGQEALASGGVVSYLWDPNGQFYYVDDNPWQRNFGFNVIYDWAAATVVIYYDTWRACFDYDNLEWMIQAWKGQYGFLFIGGEIGVYTREPGAAVLTSTHYNCADDNHLINMEMSICYDAHDGNGYKKLFTRAYYPHWWCTGFVDGHLADYKFNDRSCLVMIARMHMYDDAMTEAFTAALAKCGFRHVDSTADISTSNSDTYTTVGTDVHFSWKKIDQGYNTR